MAKTNVTGSGGGGGGGSSFAHTVDDVAMSCAPGVQVLDAVYLSGVSTVHQANATTTATVPVHGFVVSKSNPTTCIVRRFGDLSGFTSLTTDAIYYLDKTAGQIVAAPGPSLPAALQIVGQAKSSSILAIALQPSYDNLT